MSVLSQTRDHARSMAKTGGAEAALWTQIADEIDEYLAAPTEHVDLFGDTTPEPERRLCDPPLPGDEPPEVYALCDLPPAPPPRPAPLPDPVIPSS